MVLMPLLVLLLVVVVVAVLLLLLVVVVAAVLLLLAVVLPVCDVSVAAAVLTLKRIDDCAYIFTYTPFAPTVPWTCSRE
jgi:hypothetical protein